MGEYCIPLQISFLEIRKYTRGKLTSEGEVRRRCANLRQGSIIEQLFSFTQNISTVIQALINDVVITNLW